MTVACYNTEFSGDAFNQRINDFYAAMRQGRQVCDLKYQLDHNKILQATPDLLKVETYDNSHSDVPLESSFEVAKDVTETSRFDFSSALQIGAETTIKTGIPFIAEGEVKLSASLTLSFSKSHETSMTKRYVQHSTVTVPPRKKISKEAKVTRSKLMVPWTAVVVNGLGALKQIHGNWYGVTTYDLQITQRNA